jgi:hypothetical protein
MLRLREQPPPPHINERDWVTAQVQLRPCFRGPLSPCLFARLCLSLALAPCALISLSLFRCLSRTLSLTHTLTHSLSFARVCSLSRFLFFALSLSLSPSRPPPLPLLSAARSRNANGGVLLFFFTTLNPSNE